MGFLTRGLLARLKYCSKIKCFGSPGCIVLEDKSRIQQHQSHPTQQKWNIILLHLHLNTFVLLDTKCRKNIRFLQLIDETIEFLQLYFCWFCKKSGIKFAKFIKRSHNILNSKNYVCEQICSISEYKWKERMKRCNPCKNKSHQQQTIENDLI